MLSGCAQEGELHGKVVPGLPQAVHCGPEAAGQGMCLRAKDGPLHGLSPAYPVSRIWIAHSLAPTSEPIPCVLLRATISGPTHPSQAHRAALGVQELGEGTASLCLLTVYLRDPPTPLCQQGRVCHARPRPAQGENCPFAPENHGMLCVGGLVSPAQPPRPCALPTLFQRGCRGGGIELVGCTHRAV